MICLCSLVFTTVFPDELGHLKKTLVDIRSAELDLQRKVDKLEAFRGDINVSDISNTFDINDMYVVCIPSNLMLVLS